MPLLPSQKWFLFNLIFSFSGSPFDCQIMDATKIEAHGPGLKSAAAGSRAHFTVDIKGTGDQGELDVLVSGLRLYCHVRGGWAVCEVHLCRHVGGGGEARAGDLGWKISRTCGELKPECEGGIGSEGGGWGCG